MRGHALPSGINDGSDSLASVHGQPVLPGGGGGSCCRLGQCIRRLLAHVFIFVTTRTVAYASHANKACLSGLERGAAASNVVLASWHVRTVRGFAPRRHLVHLRQD